MAESNSGGSNATGRSSGLGGSAGSRGGNGGGVGAGSAGAFAGAGAAGAVAADAEDHQMKRTSEHLLGMAGLGFLALAAACGLRPLRRHEVEPDLPREDGPEALRGRGGLHRPGGARPRQPTRHLHRRSTICATTPPRRRITRSTRASPPTTGRPGAGRRSPILDRGSTRPIVPKWDANHLALIRLRGTYTSAQQYAFKVVGLIESSNP